MSARRESARGRRSHARERYASGVTTLKVTKATKELLLELQRYPSLYLRGRFTRTFDELLYALAMDRLDEAAARAPSKDRPDLKPAVGRADARRRAAESRAARESSAPGLSIPLPPQLPQDGPIER